MERDLILAWVTSSDLNGTLRATRVSSVDGRVLGDAIVDDEPATWKSSPRLASRGSTLYMTWIRSTSADAAAFFSQGTTPGTWSAPLAVTGDLSAPWEHDPRIAVAENGTVLIVLDDLAANRDGYGSLRVLSAMKRASRTSFDPVFDFGSYIGAIEEWSLIDFALDSGGAIHVAWLDGEAGSDTGWTDLMYAESAPDWSDVSSPRRIDSDPTNWSKDGPAIAVGPDGRVYVVWGDRRDGRGGPKPFLVRSILPAEPPTLAPYVIGIAFAGIGAAAGAVGFLIASRIARTFKRGS
ncbi:MAG: hypothetical protein ACT4OI_04715 [Methanobacteriota archaeon]